MSRDRSLADFTSNEPEGETDEPTEKPEPDAEPEPEPAKATFDWSPEGAACASCGETVETRWRDETGMVCDDCKAW